MTLWGRSFIYDGTPSEVYGLYVQSIDTNGINESMGSSSMEILEQKIFRKSQPYYYGSTPSPKLEFEFSAFADKEIDATAFESIQRWLFSSRQYKRLAFDQWDIQNVFFDCILNNPRIVRVGNLIQGFTCTVVCSSPFALKYPQTTSYSYSSSVTDTVETYFNFSDDKGDYLYPTSIIVTMNNEDGNFSITNLDDGNRIMEFINLSGNEILNISPLYQTVSSSTGLKRLGNFNKKFLRLVPGRNRLRVQGNVENITMENTWIAKKISG